MRRSETEKERERERLRGREKHDRRENIKTEGEERSAGEKKAYERFICVCVGVCARCILRRLIFLDAPMVLKRTRRGARNIRKIVNKKKVSRSARSLQLLIDVTSKLFDRRYKCSNILFIFLPHFLLKYIYLKTSEKLPAVLASFFSIAM